MANLSSYIPSPQSPLIDQATGALTLEWWYFFQRLLARTGGATGTSSSQTLAQLIGLSVETAMSDTPAALPTPLLAPLMADVPDAQANAFLAVLAASMADDTPRPALNPFLASLMIADAT